MIAGIMIAAIGLYCFALRDSLEAAFFILNRLIAVL